MASLKIVGWVRCGKYEACFQDLFENWKHQVCFQYHNSLIPDALKKMPTKRDFHEACGFWMSLSNPFKRRDKMCQKKFEGFRLV